MLGRPLDLKRCRIDEIDEIDEVQDVELLDDQLEGSFYLLQESGKAKEVSAEQLRDFLRLGAIDRGALVCPKGMQSWVPLRTVMGEAPAAEPASKADEDSFDVMLRSGEVKHLSLDKLDDLFRLGVVDEQTPVWQEGMASWQKLGALLEATAEKEAPEALWHVLLGPGDSRQLTLEQLDDLYRLDIVTVNTLVWQEGMTQCLPLGVVAGIEQPSARPAPASRPVPVTSAPPPSRAVSAPRPRPAASVVPAVPPSAPPVTLSLDPPAQPRGSRWLAWTLAAACAVLGLYRNDVVWAAAAATPASGKYLEWERQVFGGPTFGTLRFVERVIAQEGPLEPVKLPWFVTQMGEARERGSSSTPAPSSAPAEPQASAAAARRPDPMAAKASGTAVRGRAEPAQSRRSGAAVPRPARSRRASSSGDDEFRSVRTSDAYDPLNPSL